MSFLPVRFGKVEGNFFCRNNKLISLEGAPQAVGGVFFCNCNPNLGDIQKVTN